MTPISPFDSNFFKITNYLKLIKRNLEIKNLKYLKLLGIFKNLRLHKNLVKIFWSHKEVFVLKFIF